MRFTTLLAPLLALFFAGACATADRGVVDPVHRAMAVVAGFHDASPTVALRLEEAAGWAVFVAVDPSGPPETRAGLLFTPDHAAKPVELEWTSARPVAASRHILVILSDPADLVRLGAEKLALDDAAPLSPHDNHAPPAAGAKRWVVQSAVSDLFFESQNSTAGWSLVATRR